MQALLLLRSASCSSNPNDPLTHSTLVYLSVVAVEERPVPHIRGQHRGISDATEFLRQPLPAGVQPGQGWTKLALIRDATLLLSHAERQARKTGLVPSEQVGLSLSLILTWA